MTVAVAHQGSNDSDHVLLEAVREATRTGAETLRRDPRARRRSTRTSRPPWAAGVKDAVERVTAKAGVPPVPDELHVAAGTADDPGRVPARRGGLP